MNITTKICCTIALLTIFLSGCSTSGNASGTGNEKTTANNATPSAQSQSNSSPVNNGTASAGIGTGVDPLKAGTPIRSAKMVVDGGILYYISSVNNNKICFMDTNNAVDPSAYDKNMISSQGIKQLGDESASEILFFNNTIYYTNISDLNKIYTISIDGKDKRKLTDEPARNVIMMGEYIFYIDNRYDLVAFDTYTHKRYLLQTETMNFDSDGTNIYYESKSPDNKYSLYAMNIDGSKKIKISDDAPLNILFRDGEVFYLNGWEDNILYSNTTDGSNRVRLTDAKVSNLAYDNSWLYYINESDFNKIYRVHPDGNNNEKVCDNPFVTSMAADNGTVYFIKSADIEDIIYKFIPS